MNAYPESEMVDRIRQVQTNGDYQGQQRPPQNRPPEVLVGVEVLGKELSRLQEAVEMLRDRLRAVLRPEDPASASNPGPPPAAQSRSDLADSVYSLAQHYRMQIDNLKAITERLDV